MTASQSSSPVSALDNAGAMLEREQAAQSFRATLTISLITFVVMVPVTMMVAPLKELIAVRYAASAFWTHSFMSVNMIGAILAAPFIGLLADRNRSRKRIAAIALAADAVLLSAMAAMPSLALILVVRFLEGAAHILALSTLMAIASGWAAAHRRGRTMGIVGAAMMFGSACGTRAGGLVWQHAPGSVFQIAGVLAAAAALATLLFVAESPGRSRAHSLQRIRDVFGLLRTHPRLMIAYAYAFIDRLCVGVVITTFGLFLADVHGLDPSARSRLLLMFLLPFALLVYPAGRLVDRIGRVWPMALGSIAFGLTFASYGVLSLNGLYIAMILSGIFSAAMFAPNLTLCADFVPPAQRGAGFTGFNVAGSLGFVLGPLLAGGLFTLLARDGTAVSAYRTTFIATGSAEILCALMTFPLLLKLRKTGITE